MADTPDLGSGAARHVGSSPILGKLPNVLSEMSKRSALFPVFKTNFPVNAEHELCDFLR